MPSRSRALKMDAATHTSASRDDHLSAEGQRLAVAQGLVYVTSGLWPLVHLRSFEAITGPKTDRWLVKTIGALIAEPGLLQRRAVAGVDGSLTQSPARLQLR
jgi:hypothetical protein